ncbi:MAG TPA: HAMP domain-containing sensor histidine kinase [Chthonomonadales bacterium]|nr:HAMP domain-containing sensor histidine kinase [Chthonomonadales bacterium]
MTNEPASPCSTCFAPAERDGPVLLRRQRSAFLHDRLASAMLEAFPDMAMVLNGRRQIVAANQRMLSAVGAEDSDRLLGLRPGEAVGCLHADDMPGGCGTGPYCMTCGAVNAVVECLQTRLPVSRDCRLLTHGARDGGAVDVRVHAVHVCVNAEDLVLVALRDISAEQRRRVLERVFFHDLLNTAGGIRSIADLLVDSQLDPASDAECRQDLRQLSEQIVEEIASQRELLAAESGDLRPQATETSSRDAIDAVVSVYRNHAVAHNRCVAVGSVRDSALWTDATLLRRVLGNLVKNALEAVPQGATVTLSAEDGPGGVTFRVHNPGVMPMEVQRQVFQRSFSTKADAGRGIGTYSVRLLAERYLGGAVGFESVEPLGTTFYVALPRRMPERTAA